MTERFTIITPLTIPVRTGIYDRKKITFEGIGAELSFHEVIDLLNRHETELQQVADIGADRMIELINENEQLKSTNKTLSDFREFIDDEQIKIKEENEQLQISLSAAVEKNRKLQTILDKLGYDYSGDLK